MLKTAPLIYVVSADAEQVQVLSTALPFAHVKHIPDTEQLLRETKESPELVIVYPAVYRPPVHQVVSIMRRRSELIFTHWLAVGREGLDDLLRAGVDAVFSMDAPLPLLVQQIETLLQRSKDSSTQYERIAELERQISTQETEEEMRDQFVHMLVHDMKNPISAIMGLLEIVMTDRRIPDDLQELLVTSRDEAQHLLHLSVNMLDIRKIQAGKMNLRCQLVFGPMLEDIFEKAKGDVGVALHDRQVGIVIQQDIKPVSADPEILRRVFSNLLSNAIKHTLSGGKIRLKITAAEDHLLLSMRDNGEGIPPEDLHNIFATFEQSQFTIHGRFDTGMGLAFTKMAVEQHGGRIWVDSVWGKGANFQFTLPYAKDDEDDFFEMIF